MVVHLVVVQLWPLVLLVPQVSQALLMPLVYLMQMLLLASLVQLLLPATLLQLHFSCNGVCGTARIVRSSAPRGIEDI